MFVSNRLLDDRMSAVDDFEMLVFVDFGSAVVSLACDCCPAEKNVEFGESFGGFGEGIAFFQDEFDQFGEKFLFAGFGVLLGVKNRSEERRVGKECRTRCESVNR